MQLHHHAQWETVCAHVREWDWIGHLQFSKGPGCLQRQLCQSIKAITIMKYQVGRKDFKLYIVVGLGVFFK